MVFVQTVQKSFTRIYTKNLDSNCNSIWQFELKFFERSTVTEYKEFASNYDKQVREYDSYGHDALFGMSFEFIEKDEKLLDIGIGTGLASVKHSRLGLEVYGLDSSPQMLDACRSKSFARALNLYDMFSEKIPYEDSFFNHVVSCGVLHFMGDLEPLFQEVKRVIKPGGTFAFTIAPQNSDTLFVRENTAWGVPIFKHSMNFVVNMLEKNGFSVLKEQRLLIKGADKVNYDMLFSAMVTRYQ